MGVNHRGWTAKQQFHALASAALQDGSPYTPYISQTLSRSLNNLKASVCAPQLVNIHRTTAAYADIATTAATLIDQTPGLPIPPGYSIFRFYVMAHRRSASGSNPSLIVYLDAVRPENEAGDTAVSTAATSYTVTVQSTSYTWYGPYDINVVRGDEGEAYLSIWGQAATNGSNTYQAEYTDVCGWLLMPDEAGDVTCELPVVQVVR